MALSKKTLVELRESLTSKTLREIRDLFDSEGVLLASDYAPTTSGQRRHLLDSYINNISLDNQDDVTRVLRVIEQVLVRLTGEVEDNPGHQIASQAKSALSNLMRWLRRDGFDFRGGALVASGPESCNEMSNDSPTKTDSQKVETRNTPEMAKAPTAFVSYSWDSTEHKDWVKDLASKLRGHGVDVKLDRWELAPGDQVPFFMERAVRENEHVLIVCTPKYKLKSDSRSGGVGYEGDIMTGEVMNGQNARKFVPLLREGEWKDASPSWLAPRFHLDFRGNPYLETTYGELLNNLFGTREQAPPLGTRPHANSGFVVSGTATYTPPPQEEGPIRIKNIILDDIGDPKGDGTQGSALYRVPFQLSRRPSPDWAKHFVRTWDEPPSFSTMHRPGIARIEGDRIILDGTTVDEVAKVHRSTLKAVIDQVNRDIGEHEARIRRAEELRAEQLRQHRKSAEDAAKDIDFD